MIENSTLKDAIFLSLLSDYSDDMLRRVEKIPETILENLKLLCRIRRRIVAGDIKVCSLVNKLIVITLHAIVPCCSR